jgi:hypothetical protein
VEELLKTEKNIGKFIDYLFKRVRLITITCSSQGFAIKLFQTLNARGLDLSPADLVKSHLMATLDESKHDQFLQEWISIEDTASRLNESIGDILNYYQYYSLGQNPKKTLYEELVKIFSGKDSDYIIYEIKKFTECYEDMMEEKNPVIYSLFYLSHQIYWRSILATAKFIRFERYNELAILLRNYYFKYWIGGYTSQKIKQISFNIISMLKDGKSLPELKEVLSKKEISDNIQKRVIENLNYDCYGEKWCKPLLILLEYSLVDDDNLMNYISSDKKIHVEHILPKNWINISSWKESISEETAEEFLDNLANLTLLSGTKNIRASDHSFEEKKAIYEGKGKDGITSFQLTQDVAKNEKWSEEELNHRYTYFVKKIGDILDINLN